MTCDWCESGIPVVCGECGQPREDHDYTLDTYPVGHKPDFRPVHRIPDPEGIEGTAVVPCGRAG